MELTEAAAMLREATTGDIDPVQRDMMIDLIRESYPEFWNAVASVIDSLDTQEERQRLEDRLYAVQSRIVKENLLGQPTGFRGGEFWHIIGGDYMDSVEDEFSPVERGFYIAVEGIDGSGKTTQAAKIARALDAELIREPGGSPVGEAIRQILKDPSIEMSPLTEAYLFATARAELNLRITELLDAGRNVVSDRTVFSSYAYQTGRGGVDNSTISFVNDAAIEEVPDLVILLDLPVEDALERINGGGRDAMERRVNMEDARDKYLQMAHKAADIDSSLLVSPWAVVYGGNNISEDSVFEYILNILRAAELV